VKENILINKSGGPVGGNWTFDKENRKKYPKGKAIIATPFPEKNTYQREADQYVAKQFSKNLGTLNDSINYPIDYKTSKKWLETFLEERFEEFGDYQDSIVMKETLLNHSLLTPMLNVGLLTPEKVIKKTLEHSLIKKSHLIHLKDLLDKLLAGENLSEEFMVQKQIKQEQQTIGGLQEKFQKVFIQEQQELFLWMKP
jgi:deoxyribodipyrimidine photolyase-related protein